MLGGTTFDEGNGSLHVTFSSDCRSGHRYHVAQEEALIGCPISGHERICPTRVAAREFLTREFLIRRQLVPAVLGTVPCMLKYREWGPPGMLLGKLARQTDRRWLSERGELLPAPSGFLI
jgi:hypothetical protein